jgi:hypothetical protein
LVSHSVSIWPFDLLNPLGNIYLGWNIKTRLDVALKLEPVKTQNPHLRNEHAVYKALLNTPGFPTMHWYGTEASYNVMVLDRLSLTLEKAISKSHDDNLVFYLADQMVFFSLFHYVLKCLIHIPLVTLSTAFMS